MGEKRCDRILNIGVAILCLFLIGQVNAQDTPQLPGVSLSDTLLLVRVPEAGEIAYFRISREDISVDEVGDLTSRAVSSGRFKREVVHGNEAGTHMERYTWKDFFHSRSEDVEAQIEPAEITAIRGFSYDLSSADRHSVPPIHIGGLAKTAETFAFFVVAWDVAAITHAVSERPDYPVRNLNRIGDHIAGTDAYLPASFDFTPVVSDFSYTRQPYTATLAGLSMIGQTPTALIQFESGGNPIAYRHSSSRVTIRLTGREWTTGSVHLRLSDNAIIRAELRSSTVVSQEAMMPGKQVHHPMTVFQNVVLERVTDQEYGN